MNSLVKDKSDENEIKENENLEKESFEHLIKLSTLTMLTKPNMGHC
jgi:hypothetical protein